MPVGAFFCLFSMSSPLMLLVLLLKIQTAEEENESDGREKNVSDMPARTKCGGHTRGDSFAATNFSFHPFDE